jgi:dipeptidyl-peptidase 4
MTRRNWELVSALIWCLFSAPAWCQGTRADYERANTFWQRTFGKVYKARVLPHWNGNGTGFWYRNDLPHGAREFIRVDAAAALRQPAFDHAKLAQALSKATGKPVDPQRLAVDHLAFDDVRKSVTFDAHSKRWECSLATYLLREAGAGEPERSIPTLSAPRPTQRDGAETEVAFRNRLRETVELLWIDREGHKHSQGKLLPGGSNLQRTFAGHVFQVLGSDGRTVAVFEVDAAGGQAIIDGSWKPGPWLSLTKLFARSDRDSPDGQWTVFVKDYNLYLRSRKSGAESALTNDARADDAYGAAFFWSPDSRKLVASRRKTFPTRKVYLIESSPRDQLQPKLHSFPYAKPGDNIPYVKPHLFDIEKRREIPVRDDLFANPWEIRDIRWQRDGKRFTFLFNQRGHQVLRVIGVDAGSGQAVPLVDEQSKTFIDYAHKNFHDYQDDTGELIWMSERDGWNHLYLYDLQTGKVKNQITRGNWPVFGVDRIDAKRRQIWFRAGGLRPGQDPYFTHYARVGFDGSGLVILTEGNGNHSIDYSPDGRFFLDTYSRVDLAPVIQLRRTADGGLVCELERADISELQKLGWQAPEPFVAKGRDGTTDIYGVIFRPANFDARRNYPVVEQIYAGPQGFFVPKGFSAHHDHQALAELGFIVVQVDGMGTSGRSKAFHDVCWKNLGDAGLPDHMLWLRAAARKYPYMDLGRVGIYGGSAGGYDALRALLVHGDFYKAAVADCGCHDNRMDKIWWNELWMGWPVGPQYAAQSNVTNAHQLQGKLLLIVGELDRNVDPASTMQVVNALVRADRDFDLLVIPGAGHGAAESSYGKRRRQDFFVRHLLGVEPRRPTNLATAKQRS